MESLPQSRTSSIASEWWTAHSRRRDNYINNGESIKRGVANPNRTKVAYLGGISLLGKDILDLYQTRLGELIDKELSDSGECTIRTGHQAEGLLLKTAEEIELPFSRIAVPYHTEMIVSSDLVVVRNNTTEETIYTIDGSIE